MTYRDLDILLVEDNPYDRELTLRALGKHHLANRVQVLEDGAEALDYFFGTRVGRKDPQRPEGHPPGFEPPQGERSGSARRS